MGEYANHNGRSVKIGTCEDMLYLRADQAHLVRPERGSVDPVRDAEAIRFRFPWPDEDGCEPGSFENPFRTLAVQGASHPVPFEHGIVQFVASAGYNVCLPCPEGAEGIEQGLGPIDVGGFKVHRNGFRGAVHLSQQRVWEGRLVAVCECGGCGRAYRLETVEQVEPIVVAIRAMADREQQTADQHGTQGNADIADRLHLIADRVIAGYVDPLPW